MRIHIICFCTFKVCEKKNISKTRVDFWIQVDFGFLGDFFEAIDRLIIVHIMFYRCFE